MSLDKSCKPIEWNTDPTTLLQDSDIAELANSLSTGDISGVRTNILDKITAESENGLSFSAFNIDGRAPLQELAHETTDRIGYSIIHINEAKTAIFDGGSAHRLAEANELWEKVVEYYEPNYYKPLNEAVEDYNSDLTFEDKSNPIKETIEGVEKTVGYHTITATKLSLTPASFSPETEPNAATINDKHPKASSVKDALTKCQEFFSEYVKRAKDYKEQCSQSRNSVTAAMADEPGAQAKMDETFAYTGPTSPATPNGASHKKGDSVTINGSSYKFYGSYKKAGTAYNYYEDDEGNIYYYNPKTGELEQAEVVYSDPTLLNGMEGKPQPATTSNMSSHYYKLKTPTGDTIPRDTINSTGLSDESANNNAVVSKDDFVAPTSYNNATELMSNEKPIVIPKGSALVYDRPGIFNQNTEGVLYYSDKENDMYLVPGNDGYYYVSNEDGSINQDYDPISIAEFSAADGYGGANSLTPGLENKSGFTVDGKRVVE